MIKKVSRNEARLERHKRVRAKVSGTKEIPRLKEIVKMIAELTAKLSKY